MTLWTDSLERSCSKAIPVMNGECAWAKCDYSNGNEVVESREVLAKLP